MQNYGITLWPVSTQENKHRIGSDWTFFILYYPHRRTKKVENTSTFITESHVQTGTENRHQKPMRGFNFVPIRSDPLLIFLSGNRPLGLFYIYVEFPSRQMQFKQLNRYR